MKTNGCKCIVSWDSCIYLNPDNNACPSDYGEGADTTEDNEEEICVK